jgi:predicted transcriptional regulator
MQYRSTEQYPHETHLISFRATSSFKDALKALATRERRSQANLLEKLLFDYLQISTDHEKIGESKKTVNPGNAL